MPVQACSANGQPGYKWGDSGHCYTYSPGNETARKKAKQKAYIQGYAATNGKMEESMTTQVTEVGKKISSATAARIRAALKVLQELIPADNDAAQESIKTLEALAVTPVPSWEQVRAQLQALIDLLPPETKEQLEGDGDGDQDPVNAILQGAVGDYVIPNTEARAVAERAVWRAEWLASEASDSSAPYGNVTYADPGYQKDKKKRYPLDTNSHIRAAWSYINMPKNAAKYTAQQLASIKSKIKAAMGRIGAKTTEAEAAAGTFCGECGAPVEREWSKCAECGTSKSEATSVKETDTKENGTPIDEGEEFTADIQTEFIPLVEKAVGRDGQLQIKIIKPGWGSSGYYAPELLERDGRTAFPKGTKMFWNHPSLSEEKNRPERDLRDLAAVTTTDPIFMKEGPAGPGLYAQAKPFSAYKDAIEEMAPHIGVSILAMASGKKIGEAEGKKGPIIERIIQGKSIDFVTEPGAGGEILSLFESKRPPEKIETVKEDELDVATENELKEAKQELTSLKEENARLKEKLVLREARDLAVEEVGRVEGLPTIVKRRIIETLAADPPVDADGDFDKQGFRKKMKETIAAEAKYVEELAGSGKVRGFGTAPLHEGLGIGNDEEGVEDEPFTREMENTFLRIGLPEKVAKEAALGRR